MSNAFMEHGLSKMKESQRSAIEQLNKYKALSVDLEREIMERNQAINLFESAMNPEKANMPLREVMK